MRRRIEGFCVLGRASAVLGLKLCCLLLGFAVRRFLGAFCARRHLWALSRLFSMLPCQSSAKRFVPDVILAF